MAADEEKKRMNETTLTEQLENSIKNQPNYWLGRRDKDGNLVEVHDFDSGRVFILTDKGWFWMD